MNADPTVDAARHTSAQASYTDRLNAAERVIHDEIAALVQHADMDASCETLPYLHDYTRPMGVSGMYALKGPRNLGYALQEALDSHKTPNYDDAFALLCRAARGDDIRAEAARLMDALAWRLAEMHGEVD